ncbi:hypothetical protein ACLQ2E_21840 [Streptomyces lavendulocolor]
MATNRTTVSVDCPDCGTPIVIPLTLSYRRGQSARVEFDTRPVRAHAASHDDGDTAQPAR